MFHKVSLKLENCSQGYPATCSAEKMSPETHPIWVFFLPFFAHTFKEVMNNNSLQLFTFFSFFTSGGIYCDRFNSDRWNLCLCYCCANKSMRWQPHSISLKFIQAIRLLYFRDINPSVQTQQDTVKLLKLPILSYIYFFLTRLPIFLIQVTTLVPLTTLGQLEAATVDLACPTVWGWMLPAPCMVKGLEDGATAQGARTEPTHLWVLLLPACHNQLGQEWVLHLIVNLRREQ